MGDRQEQQSFRYRRSLLHHGPERGSAGTELHQRVALGHRHQEQRCPGDVHQPHLLHRPRVGWRRPGAGHGHRHSGRGQAGGGGREGGGDPALLGGGRRGERDPGPEEGNERRGGTATGRT